MISGAEAGGRGGGAKTRVALPLVAPMIRTNPKNCVYLSVPLSPLCEKAGESGAIGAVPGIWNNKPVLEIRGTRAETWDGKL